MIRLRFISHAIFLGLTVLSLVPAWADEHLKPELKRKRVVYKKYSEVDLAGSTVQGKPRTPEVFYIFQRKRGEDASLAKTPDNLGHLDAWTRSALREAMKK